MRVLFLGENADSGASRYLISVLRWSKIAFDHRPDGSRIPKTWRPRPYDAVILSDYRHVCWTPYAREWLINSVHSGTGLMMIGGWGSFTGLVGGYAGTEIEKLLPVNCLRGDDRVNRPAVMLGGKESPVVVNGYHKSRPKPGTRTVLEFRDLAFRNGRPHLAARYPALVTGQAGKGRTAAFLTDCAPHWAGGLIDWGKKRVQIRLGADTVEVGDIYLRFFRRWITWVAGGPAA